MRAARRRPRPREQCPQQLADDSRPNLACIAGVFTLGFGIGASVLTNNVAALAALANGLLPMRRVAELEAERRHLLEMELRHSGFLRDGGSEMRPADIGTQRFSPALAAD